MSDDSFPQPGKTYSLCMDVDAYLKNHRFPNDFNIFMDETGSALTPAAGLTFLHIEKAKGRKVIPVSAECGSPCKHKDNGCSGFDYGHGGCPGRFTATIGPHQA